MADHVPTTFTLEPFDYAEVRSLMDGLELAEPVAVTLVRRGFRTIEQARAFLEADETHDPFLFDGMEAAVRTIRAAVDAGRRITVHGDYDVDGVCSTSIVVHALRELGADCDWVIPDRMADGYGLSESTVTRLAQRGTQLLITVDCGIGSVAEVEAALAAGLEVIVTDHHQPGDALPDCTVLHPVVSGYPCPELCGTGVAYKLASALLGEEETASDLDLVALATVADLVPLRGENRALVRRGIAEARRARRPGLRALLASAAVLPERLDEGDFAFRVGPRINAAGRLYRADAGVELMLTGDEERATQIAAELERANLERRDVERTVLYDAERALSEMPAEQTDAPGLVIAGEGWHPGVVGIVASRLAEELWKPVVLIALDGEGRGRGSGRSIPGFDLLGALHACSEHLERYGGHRAAAGVELQAKNLDAFRQAFAEAVAASLPPEGRVRTEPVDAVVGGESLGHDVAEQLTKLGPFGLGNPSVRLLVAGAKLSDVRPMGEGERHARFSLASGSRRALGVAFGVNGELNAAAAADSIDVSVKLELNEWNGSVEPRVVLNRIYPSADEAERAGLTNHPVGSGREAEQPTGLASEQPTGLGSEEFWRRHDTEASAPLAPWPHPPADRGDRQVVERRGASGVATVAALVSTGEPVLIVVADAIRRRALLERAARPARFGGGEFALVSGRLGEAAVAKATVIRDSGSGAVLADWAALIREPALARSFAHVVVVDPAPHPLVDQFALAGSGYVHRLDGPGEAEFAARVYSGEWPTRATLAELYRGLARERGATDAVAADRARVLLCGDGRAHPLAPEAAARGARVLCELGLARWEGSGVSRRLGVVSSQGTDLERSEAFRVYRQRCEEGRKYLSERTQSRS